MKTKSILALCLLCVCLMACATTQLTSQRVYMETQTAYLNAWESYHQVWSAFPDADSRKAEWVQKYHPVFLKTSDLLQKFRVDPSTTNEQLLTTALNECQAVLLQLAIKGGK